MPGWEGGVCTVRQAAAGQRGTAQNWARTRSRQTELPLEKAPCSCLKFFSFFFWLSCFGSDPECYMKTELRPVNQFTKQIAAAVKHLLGGKEVATRKS